MSLLLSRRFALLSLTRRSLATDATKKEDDSASAIATDFVPEYEEKIEADRKLKELIEAKRYVARFPKETLNDKFEKKIPSMDETHSGYDRVKFYRKLYAKFGSASGIDAGVCWPTKSQLKEIKVDENEYDLGLKKKVRIAAKRSENRVWELNRAIRQAQEAIRKQPKQIEEFYQRVSKKDKTEEEKKKKKNELLDKAREYYGYDVDIRDTRIKLMMEKLEAEKKLEEKKKKTEEKKRKVSTPNI